MTTYSITTIGGQVKSDFRVRRERAGLTRARLAGLVGCSTTSLANIEDGAIPKRSAVLERALSVIAAHEDEAPGHHPERDVTTQSARQGRHDAP